MALSKRLTVPFASLRLLFEDWDHIQFWHAIVLAQTRKPRVRAANPADAACLLFALNEHVLDMFVTLEGKRWDLKTVIAQMAQSDFEEDGGPGKL
jgi:hypothetical protein